MSCLSSKLLSHAASSTPLQLEGSGGDVQAQVPPTTSHRVLANDPLGCEDEASLWSESSRESASDASPDQPSLCNGVEESEESGAAEKSEEYLVYSAESQRVYLTRPVSSSVLWPLPSHVQAQILFIVQSCPRRLVRVSTMVLLTSLSWCNQMLKHLQPSIIVRLRKTLSAVTMSLTLTCRRKN